MKKTALATLLSIPTLFSCSSPSGPSSSLFGASLPVGEKLYGEYQNESYDSLSQYVSLFFDGGVAQVLPAGGYSWYLSADEVKTLYGKDIL